jgi:hypothetical protein
VKTFEKIVIRQKVRLVNSSEEWVDVATFTSEMQAWEAFDKAKAKIDDHSDLAVVKVVESRIA